MTNFYHILVLAEAYPTQGQPAALRYIHSRNLAYRENGHDVEVINFSASSDYAIDGITVFGADSGAGIDASNYDIVLLHAPNLKHHIKWWSRHKSEIKALILFAHGHEFLDADKVYPAEFDFVQRPVIRGLVRKIYDRVKLAYWARWFERTEANYRVISVSKWMQDQVCHFANVSQEVRARHFVVVPNSIGRQFELSRYDFSAKKQYDCCTFRPSLDSSKYCIDVVTRIANSNPNLSFVVVGKGSFFQHAKRPDNLEWIDEVADHGTVLEIARNSRCALVPTRLDAQGVMACELASFGMPLITSDIAVCRDVFARFPNVRYIDNQSDNINVASIIESIEREAPYDPIDEYFEKNTIARELEVFEACISSAPKRGLEANVQ